MGYSFSVDQKLHQLQPQSGVGWGGEEVGGEREIVQVERTLLWEFSKSLKFSGSQFPYVYIESIDLDSAASDDLRRFPWEKKKTMRQVTCLGRENAAYLSLSCSLMSQRAVFNS